ncbi:MAG: hypothetical protein EPO68_16635 [Planctomycetota bacterium]|nr:MAG: hypothetical protein EPO68_16635 [Planctomycetota bacterium]
MKTDVSCRTTSRHLIRGLAAVALCGAPIAAQQLWIVDAAAGPGSQFTSIQAAVDASQADDTVLVRSGSYAGFSIDGKGVRVIARDIVRVDGTVRIRNVPSRQTALLAGLQLRATGFPNSFSALSLVSNAGSVWVQSSMLDGADAGDTSLDGGAGAFVDASSAVHFTDCAVRGGKGGSVGGVLPITLGNGGRGIDVNESYVTLDACEVRGGSGGDQTSGGLIFAQGGEALSVRTATVDAQLCAFHGGAGGTTMFAPFGGQGGHGVYAIGDASIARTSMCTSIAGEPGMPLSSPGQAYAAYSGAQIVITAPLFQPEPLSAPSCAAVGESTTVSTGSLSQITPMIVFALISADPTVAFDPGLVGLLLDPSASALVVLGPSTSPTQDSFTWTIPALPAGTEAVTTWLQLGSFAPLNPGLLLLSGVRSLTLTQQS